MSTKQPAGGSHSDRKIKVTGVRRKEIDASQIAFVYWQMAERQIKERKRKEAEEKAKRVEGS